PPGEFNRIGTDGDGINDAAERNIISGNGTGVLLLNVYSSNNIVAANYIGTDVTGAAPLGNDIGVYLLLSGESNRIGANGDGIGVAAGGNVISGNREGVRLQGDVEHNVIAGNLIGTDLTGTQPVGNGTGIFTLQGPRANRIERNVISASGVGIVLIGDDHVIAGNLIGTDITGTQDMGNGTGMAINGTGNQIAPANTIAFSAYFSILVGSGTGNRIQANSIHSNGGLGILLVASNNANANQPYPTLTAVTGGAATRVVGTLQSTPNATVFVDVYANSTPSPSGFGEGERYLGTIEVKTDNSGQPVNGSF